MTLTQALPESDGYIPCNKKGTSEAKWLREAESRFGADVINRLQYNTPDINALRARAKKALIVLSYANGTPINQIENAFTTSPFYAVSAGDITGTADNTRFRLHAVYEIVTVAYPAFSPQSDAMQRLLLQIELGIPPDTLDLVNAPVPLNRASCLALRSAGIVTVDALLAVPASTLASLLPNPTLQALKPFLGAQPIESA